MKSVKNRARVFVSAFIAVMFCLCGFCACAQSDKPEGKPQTPPAGDSYFLQKIEIDGADLIRVGGSTKLQATASARTGANKTVTSTTGFAFESSNPSVASVDGEGVVSGLKEGESSITVKHAEFGAENTFKVSVVPTVELNLETGAGINAFGRAQYKQNGLLLVNALSGFGVRFDGPELKGVFNSVTENENARNSLYVEIDGKSSSVEITKNNEDTEVVLASGLTGGIHSLRVYKRTGEEHSQIRLVSLSSSVEYIEPARAETRISFYGDKLTSGSYLGTDGDATQTYAFAAAEKLGAEPDMVSLPEASLAVGNEPLKDKWNFSSANGEVYGGAADCDWAVINLGENDAKAINGGNGTVNDYVQGYKQMVSAISAENASAKIICCYGMTAQSSALAQAVKRAVAELNAGGNKNVFALRLERCDGKARDKDGLPNAYGHKINADRLAAAIEKLGSGSSLGGAEYDANKPDISVILLGGQSNMEGNSWWRYLEGADDRFADYKNGFDGIKMSFCNHESEADKAPSFNAVKLGYGGARQPGYNGDATTCFGPEIGMAKVLHDGGYDGKVVFIKFAVGATYFHSDSSNRNWQAKSGKLYKAFIKYVGACLGELSKTYNLSIDAMCWMQGESDTEQQAHVNSYKSNLNSFVKALREHYTEYNPDFMFYDAYIKWPRDWQGDRPDQINDIKKELAEENLHYEVIDTLSAGLHTYDELTGSPDLAHFDAASEIKLGEMFAQAYLNDFPLLS